MSLFLILPNEIFKLIQEHLKATIIQNIFKLHRPLSKLECGDRVIILNKKTYATILKVGEKFCEIKLLPRIIPNWKSCNINFWNNYKNLLKDYNFPYYIPKAIKISNYKIIKLNNWNCKINIIDGEKRLSFNKINSSNIYIKSNMFGYFF